jgi:spore cortex biosynthesis protein YabQ
MPLQLSMQFNLVICSLIAGIITGILFDMYRAIRGFSSIKLLTIIEDILFWILSAILVFIFLLYNNYAYIGLYVYLFIGLGLYFYIMFLSKLFISVQSTVFKNVFKTIRIFVNNIFYPFRILIYRQNRKKNKKIMKKNKK